MATGQTDFKISFSIDLEPFAQGLKTMLSMTQATGAQVQPLLNLQIQAPNFEAIDSGLKRYQEDLRSTASANIELANTENIVRGRMAQGGEQMNVHAGTIRGVRREALHMVGAFGFVTVAIAEIANSANSGNKELEKMARGLERGTSAGFGLASTLMLIPGVGQATAIGLGAVVAVGLTLLTFFDKAEEKADRARKAMELYNQSLKGATVGQLLEERELATKNIAENAKKLQELNAAQEKYEQERNKRSSGGEGEAAARAFRSFGILEPRDFDKERKDLEAAGKNYENQLHEINDNIGHQQMSNYQLRSKIDEMRVAASKSKFEEERAQAIEEYRKTSEEIRQANTQDEKARSDALDAAAKIRDEKIRKSYLAERQVRDEQLVKVKTIEEQAAKIIIDTEEKRELAKDTTEQQRLKTTEKYGMQRIELESKFAIASLEIERKRLDRPDASIEDKKRVESIGKEIEALKSKAASEKIQLHVTTEVKLEELKTGSLAYQVQEIQDLNKRLTQTTSIEEQTLLKSQIRAAEERLALSKQTIGTILYQEEILKQAKAQLDNAQNDADRDAARERVKIEQDKLDQMQLSNVEYMKKVRERQLEEERAWLETHRVAASAIDGITAGFNAMFDQILSSQRQAVDAMDAAWLAVRNTILSTLRDIAAEEFKNFVVSSVIHRFKRQEESESAAQTIATDTKNVAVETGLAIGATAIITPIVAGAMATIAEAAASAATLVSIATFGGAAAAGEAAVVAALGTTKGAVKATKFEEGGRIQKGQVGFFEGFAPELIVPEKTFEDIARAELIPRIILQAEKASRERYLERITNNVQSSASSPVNVNVNDEQLSSHFGALTKAVKELELRQEVVIQDNKDYQIIMRRNIARLNDFLKDKYP